MLSLKLAVAETSIYTIPYRWVRTIIVTSTKPTVSHSSWTRMTAPPPFSLLTLEMNRRTLKPCASITRVALFSVHPSLIKHRCCQAHLEDLGFSSPGPHHQRLCCFSSSSSSEKVGSSSSSGSGLAADMGQDNGLRADQNCYHSHDEDRLLHQNQSPLPSPPTPRRQQQSSKLLTLPTILTLGRVAAVPLLVATFYVDDWWGRTATTSIFIAAAITDWLDGYLARRMRLGSAFGAFLDPVADKLMVAATLILFCSRPMEVAFFGQVPWLLTAPSIAIIGREITMSAVREWAASQNSKLSAAVAVNNLGKWKTATQMTALTILLATRDSSAGGLVASGVVLLYVSAGLSVWSLAVYMRKIWKVLLK